MRLLLMHRHLSRKFVNTMFQSTTSKEMGSFQNFIKKFSFFIFGNVEAMQVLVKEFGPVSCLNLAIPNDLFCTSVCRDQFLPLPSVFHTFLIWCQVLTKICVRTVVYIGTLLIGWSLAAFRLANSSAFSQKKLSQLTFQCSSGTQKYHVKCTGSGTFDYEINFLSQKLQLIRVTHDYKQGGGAEHVFKKIILIK